MSHWQVFLPILILTVLYHMQWICLKGYKAAWLKISSNICAGHSGPHGGRHMVYPKGGSAPYWHMYFRNGGHHRVYPKGGSAPYWPIWVLAYVFQKQWWGSPQGLERLPRAGLRQNPHYLYYYPHFREPPFPESVNLPQYQHTFTHRRHFYHYVNLDK